MIEILVTRLSDLLAAMRSVTREQREIRDNALRSISHALNETCIYYRRLDNGEPRDFDIEDQLSRYWAAAAIPVRHLDAALAIICEEKSDYWLNQENWPPERVRECRIGLNEVRSEYRSFLYPRIRFS